MSRARIFSLPREIHTTANAYGTSANKNATPRLDLFSPMRDEEAPGFSPGADPLPFFFFPFGLESGVPPLRSSRRRLLRVHNPSSQAARLRRHRDRAHAVLELGLRTVPPFLDRESTTLLASALRMRCVCD